MTECSYPPPLPSPAGWRSRPLPPPLLLVQLREQPGPLPSPWPAKLQPLLESQAQRQRAWPVCIATTSLDPCALGTAPEVCPPTDFPPPHTSSACNQLQGWVPDACLPV